MTIIAKAKVNKNTFAFDEDIDGKLKHNPDTVEQLAVIQGKKDQQKNFYESEIKPISRNIISKYYFMKTYKLKQLRWSGKLLLSCNKVSSRFTKTSNSKGPPEQTGLCGVYKKQTQPHRKSVL